jgi:hypothetical protein
MYRTIDADEVVSTAASLRERIRVRFPESNLARVAGELLEVAQETRERCRLIARPNIPLRIGVGALVVLGALALALVVANVRLSESFWDVENFVEGAEALVGDLVFIGLAIAFLVTLETRVKRKRALAAIHELRAIAHIIDMHQLTKDPEMVMTAESPTSVSPARNMTPFELNRYLDYCSEMLAIVSKIGALYVQSFPDAQALSAIDEIESLTTGLSRKIWQKIMILDRYTTRESLASGEPPAKKARPGARRPSKALRERILRKTRDVPDR